MAEDPVCGMEVDEERAVKSKYKGKVYYFCCLACKGTFDESPQKYLKAD